MDPVYLTYLAIAQIALTAYGTMASVNAQKQAMAYQVMQHELQQKQYKDQADSEALKTLMDENDRKKKYLSQIDENRALLSITGTTADSASYRAFFKAGKEVVKTDLQKIKLMGTERRLAALYGVQQAGIASQGVRAGGKAGIISTVGRSLMGGYRVVRETKPSWFR
jgi:hypothetical protein